MAVNSLRRLLLLSLPATALAQLSPASGAAPLEVRMVARRFVFEPDTVRARVGQPVLLRIGAPEVPMGFSLPDLHVRSDIVPGKEAQVRFTPTQAGSFGFVCDVFCGSGHEQMQGTLEVTA
jgi:cytochrome c oxidase subunit 2